MELEELKNTWKLLDSKLEEDKSLKESIILEMIHTKADKLVNKMINWDIAGVVILIAAHQVHNVGPGLLALQQPLHFLHGHRVALLNVRFSQCSTK